jgi:hypothetical protein
MCALLRYAAGGLAVILAAAYIAAATESGLSAFRPTVMEPASAGQTVVNRANKGDRETRNLPANLPASTAQTKPAPIAKEQKILEGCDPAFSPLTSPVKNNYAGRCLS